jgi:amino acid transporter
LQLVFALLTFWGFKESAMTSLVIFAIHITILSILFVTSIIFISKNGIQVYFCQFITIKHQLFHFLSIQYFQPVKDLYASAEQPNFLHSIFYGFSIASLAVTGFETSANFVEELKPGVFEKTLRNMWWFCLWINPGFSLLGILAVDADVMRKEPNATLGMRF